ncbi:MAG: hypothetical protein PUA71_10810, partial [Eubacteriales bacterium]|nr:hypothetical protein [Eubacteriales bacterium]
LWFYSNEPFNYFLGATLLFTFHYGSIQMAPLSAAAAAVGTFTFHYGSIQIIITIQLIALHTNLHSTMVLFKSVAIATQ